MGQKDMFAGEVDSFISRSYPAVLTAFVDFLDGLQDTGQVTTLDELRAELVKIVQHCRERSEYDLGE